MTPYIKKLLRNLAKADTWGHPDQFGEYAGLARLFKGDYAGALKYFRIGARYADKLSQLGIGMMYYNGRGVRKDPAKACAWLTLAAQRNYPSFVKARNGVCGALTTAQRRRSGATLHQLLPVYGDKVAKKRMALELADARWEMTGSHVGFDFGDHMSCGNAPGLTSMVQDANCSAHDYWSPQRWVPAQYFAMRDRMWQGTVTVGTLQTKDHAASKGQPRTTAGSKPPPASGSSD
jgi:TPR repeat protein